MPISEKVGLFARYFDFEFFSSGPGQPATGADIRGPALWPPARFVRRQLLASRYSAGILIFPRTLLA